MNTKDSIQATAGLTNFILSQYLSDLSDANLMQRPAPGCNHLAWQLGHLVSSNAMLLGMINPEFEVDLPEGFAEAHSKEMSSEDDSAKFHSKQEYLDLLEKVGAAAKIALETFSDPDLDAPSPDNFQPMFPTMGHMFILLATHGMMHAGQFVPVRRALNKPVLV